MKFAPDLLLCPFVPLLLCFFALSLLCSVVAAWSRVHEVCHLLGAQCRPKIGCFQFGTATNQPTDQGTNTINTTPTPTKHNTNTNKTQHQNQHKHSKQTTDQPTNKLTKISTALVASARGTIMAQKLTQTKGQNLTIFTCYIM